MASRTVVKHFIEACDLPSCLTNGSTATVFFKDGRLTTDVKPFIDGTITAITQTSSGGYDVSFTYNDATMPFVIMFPTGSAAGNSCDPDCLTECSWVWKMRKSIPQSLIPLNLLVRAYQLYSFDAWVANGTFDLPRIPFDEGFRMTEVKLTCFTYDPSTTATIELKVDGVTIASFSGSLLHCRGMNIAIRDIAHDKMPMVVITNVTSAVYDDAALGLVIEIVGTLIPA